MRPNNFFLSCDWGSSNVRLRLVETDSGEILAETASPEGVSQICSPEMSEKGRQSALAIVLKQLIAELKKTTDIRLKDLPVVLSGMVTSAHGWYEIPYAVTPLELANPKLNIHQTNWQGHPMIFVGGLRTDCDVMRGEEVELLGLKNYFNENHDFSKAVVILPGTHSKHVFIENGWITDFHTSLTGELFELLSKHSVLRHSLGNKKWVEQPDDFARGVQMAMKRPLLQSLFQVRTRHLLQGIPAEANQAYLSGLLIGSELKNLANLPAQTAIIVAAGTKLKGAYRRAFETLKLPNRLICVTAAETAKLSAAGHRIIYQQVSAINQNERDFYA